jgi:hypothetical protein
VRDEASEQEIKTQSGRWHSDIQRGGEKTVNRVDSTADLLFGRSRRGRLFGMDWCGDRSTRQEKIFTGVVD